MPVIYKIQSPSGKVYIGQSWNFKSRKKEHSFTKRTNHPLYASIGKYGFNNHQVSVIHELPKDVNQEIIDVYEQLYMDAYRAAGVKLMNLQEAGSKGKHCEESKKRMSLSRTGLKQTAETIEKRVSKIRGVKRPQWVQDKINAARIIPKNIGLWNRGKIRTEGNRKKISDTLKAATFNKGENHHMAKLTNETVLQIRSKYKPKGVYSTLKLAKEYNLSNTNIKDIVNRKIWRNI